jgi:two-component system, OmpR family, alkaline phosphatase synthesis response regulator PhoP
MEETQKKCILVIKKRILVIEDEPHIAEALRLNLNLQGYEAEIAVNGEKGLKLWRSWEPDMIVLDIMMPIVDGFTVLRTIRNEDKRIPILILSARGDTQDKVKGLKYGVDDYLSKPFDLEEFLLRVERLIRKADWYEDGEEKKDITISSDFFSERYYSFGENHIDFQTFKTQCQAGEIILTEQEIILLKLFIANVNKPLSREILLNSGWGYSKDTATRTVDNFIVRFRKYFEKDPKKPVHFLSRRSFGYVFVPE